MRISLLGFSLIAVGCGTNSGSMDAAPLVDMAVASIDAATAPADLAKPDLAMPDLAMPDLAKPDLAMPDLALPPPDLSPVFGLSAPTNITVGANATAVVTADYNNDTKLDLVVGNDNDNTVNILLGNGAGSFTISQTYGTGTTGGVASLALGNFGSSPRDIVVTSNNKKVSVLQMTGQTLVATKVLSSGLSTTMPGIGKFDGDANLDLALPDVNSPSLSIYLGAGDGTFTAGPVSTVGPNPRTAIAGLLNNDPHLDLVVTNSGDGTVSVLIGKGNGTFETKVDYLTGANANSGPNFMALADLNGDTKLDLVVANGSTNTIGVLLGKGDGTFLATAPFTTANNPRFPVLVDLNGDQKLDLAVGAGSSTKVHVHLGNGDGTFQSKLDFAAGLASVGGIAVGDFNGDTHPDLAAAVGAQPNGTVAILLNTSTWP